MTRVYSIGTFLFYGLVDLTRFVRSPAQSFPSLKQAKDNGTAENRVKKKKKGEHAQRFGSDNISLGQRVTTV